MQVASARLQFVSIDEEWERNAVHCSISGRRTLSIVALIMSNVKCTAHMFAVNFHFFSASLFQQSSSSNILWSQKNADLCVCLCGCQCICNLFSFGWWNKHSCLTNSMNIQLHMKRIRTSNQPNKIELNDKRNEDEGRERTKNCRNKNRPDVLSLSLPIVSHSSCNWKWIFFSLTLSLSRVCLVCVCVWWCNRWHWFHRVTFIILYFFSVFSFSICVRRKSTAFS